MEPGLGVELHLPADDTRHTTCMGPWALSYFGISGWKAQWLASEADGGRLIVTEAHRWPAVASRVPTVVGGWPQRSLHGDVLQLIFHLLGEGIQLLALACLNLSQLPGEVDEHAAAPEKSPKNHQHKKRDRDDHGDRLTRLPVEYNDTDHCTR